MPNLSSFLNDLKNRGFLRRAKKFAKTVNSLESRYSSFSDSDFKLKTEEFKGRIAKGENPEKFLAEAFALVKSAARKLLGTKVCVCGIEQEWDMVHYDVQLVAGLSLYKNMVAEIATGEGKTLIATLPAYVYALYGKGCHIATVNEYLARRDCEWMRPIYNLLGLRCDYVYSGQSSSDKKSAYLADITYGTSTEFGFDYLRDNSMTSSIDEKVQRGFFFCLIDEADSILIDEARTPLIISDYDYDEPDDPFKDIHPLVKSIVAAQTRLANSIAGDLARSLSAKNALDENGLKRLYQVKLAAPRNKILKQILEKGVVNIAFEKLQLSLSTGFNKKALNDLKEELYYVVDEKFHRATLTTRGQEFLSPKNPDAFTMPDCEKEISRINSDASLGAAERSRLAAQVRAALMKKSGMIHSFSQLLQAYALYERDVDYIVSGSKVEIIDPNTGRVMYGRRWSDGLHQAVEAKEGVKIERENLTCATISIQNYFRMYSKLAGMSGTAKEQADEFSEVYGMGVIEIPTNKPCVRRDLDDIVMLTRREKYRRVLEILSGAHSRGQPVLVGTPSVEESEVVSKMLRMAGIKHNVLNAKNNSAEAKIVAQAGRMGQITIATNMAGRGTDIKLGEGVNELGGLLVLSTSHHHSRRVDRQLMGRCARQGDNGETVFVVSLEDDLIRLHADTSVFQKAIKNKHKDGVELVHPLLKRLISRAQDEVETEYSSARKEMLKFDNPANKQRSIVYSLRDEIISAENPDFILDRYIEETVDSFIGDALPPDDLDVSAEDIDMLCQKYSSVFPAVIKPSELAGLGREKIAGMLVSKAESAFKNMFEDIDTKTANAVKKRILSAAFDSAWRAHIAALEDLRNGIYLRSYAQKDPYCEFEKEAFEFFKDFMEQMRETALKAMSLSFADAASQTQNARRDIKRALIR